MSLMMAATIAATASAKPVKTEFAPHLRERAAIADLNHMLSAQSAYKSASGEYGELSCLHEPWRCIADYPDAAPVFLRIDRLPENRHDDYERTFHPVMPNLESWAYTTTPKRRTHRLRSFCADPRGVYVYAAGTLPQIREGRCADYEDRIGAGIEP